MPPQIHPDPQTPRLPPRPPSVTVLSDFDDLERILVFANLLAPRLEHLLSTSTQPTPTDRGAAIRAWITNRAGSDIDLSDLARYLDVSVSRAGHLVREHCATTFPKLLAAARLTKARNLLGMTQLRIVDIAKRCGFRDHRYFLRCFKRAEGQTPEAWRQRQCEV